MIHLVPYILAYKSEVLSEAKGEFIDVTPISRFQFLPDQIMDCFPFYRHYAIFFVVNISRISISLRNVQNKIECIEKFE